MKLGKILFLAGLLILVWPVAHTGMVIYRGLDDHTGHAHIGVVFGTGAVSPRLEARISKALALYQAGKLNRFFLTGVRRENRFMYDFLRKHQVPADKIIFDHAGYNTYASVKNLKKYLQENQAEHSASTILAVSQYFHILRIQMTFRLADLKLDYHAHADLFQWYDVYMLLREFAAFYVYWFQYGWKEKVMSV